MTGKKKMTKKYKTLKLEKRNLIANMIRKKERKKERERKKYIKREEAKDKRTNIYGVFIFKLMYFDK